MYKLTSQQWQLLLIRVYLGLDIIPHFLEKLFLGTNSRAEVAHAFVSLGVPDPLFMVVLAGLIEFAIFIGFTFGLMTRVAAIGSACYLLFAAFLGHHFTLGFIWVTPGGGWEFPVLWAFLCASFVFTGGGPCSLDAWLYKRWAYKIFK